MLFIPTSRQNVEDRIFCVALPILPERVQCLAFDAGGLLVSRLFAPFVLSDVGVFRWLFVIPTRTTVRFLLGLDVDADRSFDSLFATLVQLEPRKSVDGHYGKNARSEQEQRSGRL